VRYGFHLGIVFSFGTMLIALQSQNFALISFQNDIVWHVICFLAKTLQCL